MISVWFLRYLAFVILTVQVFIWHIGVLDIVLIPVLFQGDKHFAIWIFLP